MKTNMKRLEKVNARAFNKILTAEIKTHRTTLRGKSGEGRKWEDAFIEGIGHARWLLRKMRRAHVAGILVIAFSALLGDGCTIDYTNRTFPIPTWYWSANAKEQRRMKEQYKQMNKEDENWTDDTNKLEETYQTIMRVRAHRAEVKNQ
jgi:hypothetical protein